MRPLLITNLNLQLHDISTGWGTNQASAHPLWLGVHLAHIPNRWMFEKVILPIVSDVEGDLMSKVYLGTWDSHSDRSLSRGSWPQGPWAILCTIENYSIQRATDTYLAMLIMDWVSLRLCLRSAILAAFLLVQNSEKLVCFWDSCCIMHCKFELEVNARLGL